MNKKQSGIQTLTRNALAALIAALVLCISIPFEVFALDNAAETENEATVLQQQESVAINEENFPDETFRKYVASQVDINDDYLLSPEEIAAVTDIKIHNVASLKGIEFFWNLEKLDCQKFINGDTAVLTELDVSQNKNLISLNCYSQDIKSLDLSQNSKLQELNCVATDLTEIDVSNNPNLIDLECWSTGIRKIDVSQNEKLEKLGVGWSLALTEVVLGNKPSLTQLTVNRNSVTSLDISQCPVLEELVCWETKIESLDLSHNPNLTRLSCYDTNIWELDLSNNHKLSTVWTLGHSALAVKASGEYQIPNFDSSGGFISFYGTEFSLKELAPSIELDRISEMELSNGATWNEETGTIENITETTKGSYLYTTDGINAETKEPMTARIEFTLTSLGPAPEKNGWVIENGVEYWYENGVKQGTEGRGKEIYDPESDAWYWLDAVQGGAKTVNKDVYQESEAGQWADRPDGTGKWVRYDANGHMVKGWSTNENGTYYFDPVYGTMAKGEASIDGKACYFDQATGVGADQEWVNLSGNEYWYEDAVRQGHDPNDAGYRGKEIYDPASDAWYWLDNVDGGKKAVSKDVYQESEAGQWADRPDGTGKWVRYDANGHMVKGWQTTSAGTYYFDPVFGTMAKGDAVIDGQSHYFDPNTGVMVR